MNNSGVPLEEIKLDYIDYIEKIKNKKINKNKIFLYFTMLCKYNYLKIMIIKKIIDVINIIKF